jgi:hypothetical protein
MKRAACVPPFLLKRRGLNQRKRRQFAQKRGWQIIIMRAQIPQ